MKPCVEHYSLVENHPCYFNPIYLLILHFTLTFAPYYSMCCEFQLHLQQLCLVLISIGLSKRGFLSVILSERIRRSDSKKTATLTGCCRFDSYQFVLGDISLMFPFMNSAWSLRILIPLSGYLSSFNCVIPTCIFIICILHLIKIFIRRALGFIIRA